MNDGGRGGESREVEEERRGVTSLCHRSSPVAFHAALTPRCSAVLIVAQPRFMCMSTSCCPLLSAVCVYVHVCVYTGSDTRTTMEHSSDLTRITPCSHAERGEDRIKKTGEFNQWV